MNSQPGWYPDPQNPAVMRYWDGTQWTQHTQAGQPIPFQGQPPKKKGKVLIPILAALGGLIVIIVGLSIVTSPSSSTKNTTSETTPAKIEPNLADVSTYKEVDERELALILKDMRGTRRAAHHPLRDGGAVRQRDGAGTLPRRCWNFSARDRQLRVGVYGRRPCHLEAVRQG